MLDKKIEIDLKLNDESALASDYLSKAYWFAAAWSDVEQAKKEILRALELITPKYYDHSQMLVRAYVITGQYERASAEAKKWVVVPHIDAIVSAYIDRSRGNLDDAIKEYLKFIQGNYMHLRLQILYELAYCYFETGEYDRAIEAVQRANNIFSDRFLTRAAFYPRSFYLLGINYEAKGDRKLAIRNFEKFLDLWKEADEDLVELVDAKARYAKLKGRTEK